jgi:hypothetical protein
MADLVPLVSFRGPPTAQHDVEGEVWSPTMIIFSTVVRSFMIARND